LRGVCIRDGWNGWGTGVGGWKGGAFTPRRNNQPCKRVLLTKINDRFGEGR
jgi:hypothetical protein